MLPRLSRPERIRLGNNRKERRISPRILIGNPPEGFARVVLLNGNFLKFTQNPALREYLLSTGDNILVEASPLDAVWGIRMGKTNEHAQDPLKWKGQNLLGFALMEVRDEIRRVWKNAALCEAVD